MTEDIACVRAKSRSPTATSELQRADQQNRCAKRGRLSKARAASSCGDSTEEDDDQTQISLRPAASAMFTSSFTTAAAIAFHAYAEADELGALFPVPPPLQARFDAYREVYRKYQPADARYLENHRGTSCFCGRKSRSSSPAMSSAASPSPARARS
jgi:hypothetical protein